MNSINQNRRAFRSACILNFLLRMEWSVATTQLPIYVHELGASAIEVSLVSAVFSGIMVFSLALWGYLSDRYRKRKIFMVFGMLGLCFIFMIMSTTTNISALIFWRGNTALFVGAIVPTSWALISEMATNETIGEKMGVLNGSEMAGFGLGPIVGGVIADYLGFKNLWIFVAAICLVGGLVFLVFGSDIKVDNQQHEKVQEINITGSTRHLLILYTVFSIFLLGIAILGPNKNVYLVEELGMSRTMFGLFESIGILSSTLIQPYLGSLSDKAGRKPVMILSATSLTIGLATLYVAKNTLQAIPSTILMANYNSFQMAASAYISDKSIREERGLILGFLNSIGSVSRTIGSILGGILISETSIQTAILVSILFPPIAILITTNIQLTINNIINNLLIGECIE